MDKKSPIKVIFTMFMFVFLSCGKEEKSGIVKEYERNSAVTITFISSKAIDSDIWKGEILAQDGTKIQIIEETLEYYSNDGKESYREILKKRLENNTKIDLYLIQAEDVIEFESKNWWLDLSNLKTISDLSEDVLIQSTYRGKVFSIPLSYTGFGFYWNVDMLKKYKLEVPKNRDEFLKVCKILKEKGITPYIGSRDFALTVPTMAAGFYDLYNDKNSEDKLKKLSDGSIPVSTYMLKGFEFLEMMREEKFLDTEQSLATSRKAETMREFFAEKGAFMCMYISDELEAAPFEMKLTGIPVLKDGEITIVGADQRIAINPNSKNLKYAIEALEFITNKNNMLIIAKDQKKIAAVKSQESYFDKEYKEFVGLVQSKYQIPNQDFRMSFNTWINIRELSKEILGGRDAKWAAEEYDRIQAKEIKQWTK